MLFESILCAVLYVFFKCFDYQLGTLYAFRPIVVCPVLPEEEEEENKNNS